MSKEHRARCITVVVVLVLAVGLMVIQVASSELRQAGLKKMDDAGYHAELEVVSQDQGPIVDKDRATIKLKITNTGSIVWKDGEEHYIALGGFVRKPIDVLTGREGHANDPQLRITPGMDVKPGDFYFNEVGFQGLAPGKYEQRFQMVKEGNPPKGGWFGPIVVYRFEVR